MMNDMYYNEDELQHHGILGMRWGIRRYQPYPSGQRVKGGREVGDAAKVKQRGPNKSTSMMIGSSKTYKSGQTRRLESKVNKLENRKQYDEYRLKSQGSGINDYRQRRLDKTSEKLAKAQEKAQLSAQYDRKSQNEWKKVSTGMKVVNEVLVSPLGGLTKTYSKVKASPDATKGEAVLRTLFDVWNPVYPFIGDRTLQRTLARYEYINEGMKKKK